MIWAKLGVAGVSIGPSNHRGVYVVRLLWTTWVAKKLIRKFLPRDRSLVFLDARFFVSLKLVTLYRPHWLTRSMSKSIPPDSVSSNRIDGTVCRVDQLRTTSRTSAIPERPRHLTMSPREYRSNILTSLLSAYVGQRTDANEPNRVSQYSGLTLTLRLRSLVHSHIRPHLGLKNKQQSRILSSGFPKCVLRYSDCL